MSTTIEFNPPSTWQRLSAHLRHFRWKIRWRLDRYGIAWRYAMGRSTLEDGYDLMRHGEQVTGCFALEYIGTEGLLETASYRWKPNPELEALAHEAADHVADKWNSTGDITSAAEEWALEKIAEYAADRGIELEEVDDV